MMEGVIVGDTLPALWVGAIVGLLIVLGQARARRWHLDKISTRPGALVAFGLLVFFGAKSANGALSSARLLEFLLTLAGGVVIGVVCSWTLHLWSHPLGLFVKGSPGTIALWVACLVGVCVVYGEDHIGFGGLVLFEGATFLAQQLATIYRGVRARPVLEALLAGPRPDAAATATATATGEAVAPAAPAAAIQGP